MVRYVYIGLLAKCWSRSHPKTTVRLRFNSGWVHNGNRRTPSTWGDVRTGWQPTDSRRIKTQTCPIFRGRHGAKRLREAPHALSPSEALDELDGVLAGVNLQLAIKVAHVGTHGVVAHVEFAGNTALAVPLGMEEYVRPGPAGAPPRIQCPSATQENQSAARSEGLAACCS